MKQRLFNVRRAPGGSHRAVGASPESVFPLDEDLAEFGEFAGLSKPSCAAEAE